MKKLNLNWICSAVVLTATGTRRGTISSVTSVTEATLLCSGKLSIVNPTALDKKGLIVKPHATSKKYVTQR